MTKAFENLEDVTREFNEAFAEDAALMCEQMEAEFKAWQVEYREWQEQWEREHANDQFDEEVM